MHEKNRRIQVVYLSISILNADFACLEKSLNAVAKHADFLHIDIMDGSISPDISFGQWILPIVKSIYQGSIEVHLYVKDIMKYLNTIIEFGVERVVVDARTAAHLLKHQLDKYDGILGVYLTQSSTIDDLDDGLLRHLQCVNVVCVESLEGRQSISWDRVELTRVMDEKRKTHAPKLSIVLDGGINRENLEEVLRYPIDQVVIGSAILESSNPSNAAYEIREILNRRSDRVVPKH